MSKFSKLSNNSRTYGRAVHKLDSRATCTTGAEYFYGDSGDFFKITEYLAKICVI